MIKAIETVYNGYRFRSRLEARWAVFFDAIGIKYEYEPEGYEYKNVLSDGPETYRWLPDFRLPNEDGLLIEVKGSDEALKKDWKRLYSAVDSCQTPASNGLMILGDIPNPDDVRDGCFPAFTYMYHFVNTETGYQGTNFCEAMFSEGFPINLSDWGNGVGGRTDFRHVARGILEISQVLTLVNIANSREQIHASYDWRETMENISSRSYLLSTFPFPSDTLKAAYAMARQARFEHGETPKVSRVS